MATVSNFAEWVWTTKPWEEMEGCLTPGGPDGGVLPLRQHFDNWLEEQHVGDAYKKWQEDLSRREKCFKEWLGKQSDYLHTQYKEFWDKRGVIAKWTSPLSGVGYRVKQYDKFLTGLEKHNGHKQQVTWRANFEKAFTEASAPRQWLLEQSPKTRENFSSYVGERVLPYVNTQQHMQWQAEYEEFIDKSTIASRSVVGAYCSKQQFCSDRWRFGVF